MNLRQGRIGKQETASLAIFGCTVCGLFSVNTKGVYASGNSSYLFSILSALISLLLFNLIAAVMRRKRCKTLTALYRMAFGRGLAALAGFITMLTLIYVAVMPLSHLLMIMGDYIFVEAKPQNIALHLLPCVLVPAWLGLEILGRTARLFVTLFLLSIAGAFLIATPLYEAYRLFPLLGNGLGETMWLSLVSTSHFFPALLCLLICGVGVHGVDNAAQGASIGAIAGGLVTSGSHLLMGMLYPYYMLSEIPAPMYRVTMSVSNAKIHLRADKVLLFFWTISTAIASGFLSYSAALLLSGTTRMRDIRPAVATICTVVCAATLVAQFDFVILEPILDILWKFIWIPILLPPLLAALIASRKKETMPCV